MDVSRTSRPTRVEHSGGKPNGCNCGCKCSQQSPSVFVDPKAGQQPAQPAQPADQAGDSKGCGWGIGKFFGGIGEFIGGVFGALGGFFGGLGQGLMGSAGMMNMGGMGLGMGFGGMPMNPLSFMMMGGGWGGHHHHHHHCHMGSAFTPVLRGFGGCGNRFGMANVFGFPGGFGGCGSRHLVSNHPLLYLQRSGFGRC